MNLTIIHAIQSIASPTMDILAQGFTMLGEQVLLAALFCVIYWCINKDLGWFLIFTLGASLSLNGLIKDVVRATRPIGAPGVRSLRIKSATGYSFPSGHSQAAATFWGGLAFGLRSKWLRLFCATAIVLVGFSRLYLGVHYLIDVLGGIVLGLVVCGIFHKLHKNPHLRRWIPIVTAVLGGLTFVFGSSPDTVLGGSLVLGLLTGWLLEKQLVNFAPCTGFAQAAMRVGLGLIAIGVVYFLPKALLPDTDLVSTLQIGLVAFVSIGGYPWLFTKLKL